VWISSGCGSAVVRRSSRSLRDFGVSLPVAWSHPTLAGIKLFIRCSIASYLYVHQPTVMKIGPTLYRYPIGTYHTKRAKTYRPLPNDNPMATYTMNRCSWTNLLAVIEAVWPRAVRGHHQFGAAVVCFVPSFICSFFKKK
jgi:hypothetical protein